MEPLTLRFQFELPDDVKATVIQDVHDSSSVVNYTHEYTLFSYGCRALRSDVSMTFSQRAHVIYHRGKMSNELTITYEITNARLEDAVTLFDDQTVPAQTTASLDFTYVKEDGDSKFKLASIHRGIDPIFVAGDGNDYFPSLDPITLDLRTELAIRDGAVYVPLLSSKFGGFDDVKVPLEVTR